MRLFLFFLMALAACDAKDPGTVEGGTANILFGLEYSSVVTLTIEDCYSNTVRHLIKDQDLPFGYHTFQWQFSDDDNKKVPRGMYFYRLRVADQNGVTETVREMLAIW